MVDTLSEPALLSGARPATEAGLRSLDKGEPAGDPLPVHLRGFPAGSDPALQGAQLRGGGHPGQHQGAEPPQLRAQDAPDAGAGGDHPDQAHQQVQSR